MTKKIVFFFTLLFVVTYTLGAETKNDYEKGWENFSKNERAEARKNFELALKNPETKCDALFSLALLDWNEEHNKEAFDKFRLAFETTENPDAYLYAFSSLPLMPRASEIFNPDVLAFFEKTAANPKTNGTIRTMLYENLGEHYTKVKNTLKADEYYNKMGALKNWQVLGTFDNTSGSGFSKDWGAISNKKPGDIFKNKVNADITWYTPPFNKPNNWFAFDYYFYLNNAIMYAQTYVNSPDDKEVFLRAGTSGSVKIWVNDALVGSVVEERNCDLDIYGYKVKLNKGYNRIVVQIGASEINQANFMLRLTDENANPLSNLTSTSENKEYTPSTEKFFNNDLLFFAEKFFIDKIAANKHNPLNYFLLSEVYLRNDKSYEAIKTLRSAEALFGKSTLSSYRLHEGYYRAKNQTDQEKELETIKNTDPNSSFALQAKFDELIESEKYTEAAEICQKVKSLYGESSVTENWDLNLLSYQKRFDDMIAMAKELYKKYPNKANYMQLNYLIESNMSKNPKSAISVIEKYAKRISDNDVNGVLANAYINLGDSEKGLALLYDRIKNNPYAVEYYSELITTLFNMQQYGKAIELSDKALLLAPYISAFYTTRGFIYKNMNQTDKSRENFQKSVYYGPTSYESRNQLRLLDNKKEFYELFPKTDLQQLISKAPGASDYPEDNSVILLNEYQHIIYPEGAKEYRYEIATKILNQSGIELWKEYGIGYSYYQKLIIDKAEVIKANGTTVKAETNNDNQVVFTNLEVNDVLHLEYRIQDMSSGKLANHFFDDFLFKYSIPTLISRYSILVPDSKEFKYTVSNGNVQPKIEKIENMKLYCWELNNQTAVKDESHMSSLVDIAPTLHLSSMPDWQYVSDWYKDITTSKFKSDYVVKETLSTLLSGKENLSQLAKARLFYEYILSNFAYSSVSFLQSNFIPQSASRTITTRLGDCKDLSTLFVALCRESGINANLVLISTRDRGNNTLPLPSIGFNHCIARLIIDNRTYYLELTDNHLPFGAALKEDINAQILPIPFADEQAGSALIKMQMPDRTPNSSLRRQTVNFAGNDMNIGRANSYYGAIASYKRSDYKNIGAEEQMKSMNQTVADEFNVSAKASALVFGELQSLTDSVTESYVVEVKNAIQDVAGMKIFRLPWTDKNSLKIVSPESRQYPMEYWNYQIEDNTTEILTIELPQGKKFVEAPQNIRYECPSAVFTLSFSPGKAGSYIVTRHFERKQDTIPVSDYPAFRDFLNKVSESDNKNYAFK
ncbi:MAG: transglutaminase protein [Bacteroidetes bacterium]|nr:transglutaminase protein [Bacteroidota bacterium]